MEYQSLYRRYRPGRFADVRGQRHVVLALQNAVRLADKAYALSPDFRTASTLGRLLAKTGERERAREVLDQALTLGRQEALKNKHAQLKALEEFRNGL